MSQPSHNLCARDYYPLPSEMSTIPPGGLHTIATLVKRYRILG